MKKCAVIIAAFNAEKYILECYNSVKNQVPLEGWEYEIRIGVDRCPKTAYMLWKNNIPFFWSDYNVGAYVIRNSLIYLNPADSYSYFDADDVMLPGYLIKSLKDNHPVVMTAKINCNENLTPIQGARIEYGGAITFDNNVVGSLGGFCGVRCAADSDFMDRAKMAGYEIKKIMEGLYYRRRHPQSLTWKPDTGIKSSYRKKVWAEMTEQRNQGIIKIEPDIVTLKKILPGQRE